MVNMSEDTTICDPDGDVKLIVQKAKLDGGGKHFILVSSKILCLTSIVFRAMLGPSWKEGSELAASISNSKPYELALPEDNAEAMVLLCNVLHHRTDAYSQGEIWPACLLDFAVVCNKYDCCSAVNFHVTTWMKLFLREGHAFRNKADVACVLLNAAYLLDCPVEFNDISKRIIMDSAVPMIEILDWGAHGIIPLQAYTQLHYRQQSLRRHVLKAIEQLENAQDCITMIGNFRCRHKCSLELLGHLKSILQASIRQSTINIRDVDRWGIFGLTEILSRHDFSTPIDKFVQQHPELRSCRSCSPEFDETFIPTLLSKVNSDSDANGLCLDCVKLYSRNNCWPDEMPDPMPCRVAHPPERLWG